MALTPYSMSAPLLAQHLTALSAILGKAQAHCEARKIDPSILLGMRIFPDMFPLERQIRSSTQHAMSIGRLAGLTPPDLGTDEKSFADFQARIAKAIDFIKTWSKDAINAGLEREIVLKLGGSDRTFTGETLLLGFAMPNFWFHTTTAYTILRHAGVEIGKRDFMGSPVAL